MATQPTAALAGVANAANAASTIFNGKSFRVSWTESRNQRDAGEEVFKPVALPFSVTYYISSTGKPFKRTTAGGSSGRAIGSQDKVGASGGNGEGSRTTSVSGTTLTDTLSSGGLGRRVRVNYSGGASCSAEVVTGKSGNGITSVRSVATGRMVEFTSVSAGAATCSVQEGNAFAN